ncbi:hypothetical protein E4P42_02245 [Mycobacterium sp. PS03-16]|uniref:hypothetical protein n=1 Tax=Mycobacterium sp. PS03-16 TaxID=2559611 RepID=UPI0010748ED8|nr:hypothetical protein [Mycobacterium sp. PS03-16]TFV61017.1 hypothetical protein E4P42_02245 [Mycobacterium sp. PS03-16]
MHYETFGSSRVPGSYTSKDLQRAADMWRFQIPRAANSNRITVATLLQPTFDELSRCVSAGTAELVANAIDEYTQLVMTRTERGDLWPAVSAGTANWPNTIVALQDSEATELLQICLGALTPDDWAAQSMVAHGVGATAARREIGHRLVATIPQIDVETAI